MGAYDNTIGVLLIGIFFNTYLYGLVTFQFIRYFQTKYNDALFIKLMVLFLFVLDTVHSASVIYLAWFYTVENFANPTALAVAFWPLVFTPIATALAAFATQLFLGWRIWRLSKSNILFGVIIALAVPSLVLGFVCGVKSWIIYYLAEFGQIDSLVTSWLVMQVFVDSVITTALTVILSRSRTGFRKTDSVINRLIRGAIQTGLFAGLFSLGDLISFLQWPSSNLFGMFAIPIGRIYTNTLLDTLLSRNDLREQLSSSVNLDTVQAYTPGSRQRVPQSQTRSVNVDIRKDVEVVTVYDAERDFADHDVKGEPSAF